MLPTTSRESCLFRFLSSFLSFLRNSAFYPHLRNPQTESAFYPHLRIRKRNPRFILICGSANGIRVLSSFAESASAIRSAFRIPFPRFIPTPATIEFFFWYFIKPRVVPVLILFYGSGFVVYPLHRAGPGRCFNKVLCLVNVDDKNLDS